MLWVQRQPFQSLYIPAERNICGSSHREASQLKVCILFLLSSPAPLMLQHLRRLAAATVACDKERKAPGVRGRGSMQPDTWPRRLVKHAGDIMKKKGKKKIYIYLDKEQQIFFFLVVIVSQRTRSLISIGFWCAAARIHITPPPGVAAASKRRQRLE